jgi:HSP20 family protein
MFPFAEVGDLADDVRRLFEDLERAHAGAVPAMATDCVPALDVFETAEAFEVLVDLPGIDSSAVRVLIKCATLLIVGEKWPPEGRVEAAAFHMAERGFGRFARGIRLTGAVDTSRARARFRSGELRIVVPKIDERRGREIVVPIESAP